MRAHLACAALALAACGKSDLPRIQDAWTTPPPSGTNATEGYLTFDNGTDLPMEIAGVNCLAFGSGLLSDTAAVTDKPTVRSIPVAPHASVKLQPSQVHVLLLDPNRTLAPGDRLQCDVTVHRGDQDSITIDFEMKVRASRG